MAVRVRIRVGAEEGPSRAEVVDCVAVANSGFESDRPEVLLPAGAAARIGYWPLPAGVAREDRYESPFGTRSLAFVDGGARVTLRVAGGRTITCGVTVSPDEHQVVLNDQAVGALRIELTDVARGRWRLRGETRLRRSARPQRW